MPDSSRPLPTSSESLPVNSADAPDVVAWWGGFLAAAFNWYVLAKTVSIYQSDLRLSVTGSSCGTCAAEGVHQVFVVAPLWIAVGVLLWLRVRAVAPRWASLAKWPIRFAVLGWISVILAAIGTTLLSTTAPFLHRV